MLQRSNKALVEIRDKKYYADVLGYETFEEYCKERWDFQWNYAYKQIAAAQAIENLKTCTIVQPLTESQARPLTKLEPEQKKRQALRKTRLFQESAGVMKGRFYATPTYALPARCHQ
jgi:hypothetical protein